MSLACKDINIYGLFETPSLDLFAQAERRCKEKKKAIEDMQNEYNLLEEQAFNLYRDHVDYFNMADGFFDKTSKWLHMKETGLDNDGNKLDGRKKYDEKDIYEYFHCYLQNLLGIDDMVITQICDWNIGEGHNVYFDSHEHSWILEIPRVKGIRMKSYQRDGSYCFKIKISLMTSEHCSKCIGSTFLEEDLKDIMAKGIKETEELKDE